MSRAQGALVGLAVGDALGTTYEFQAIDQPAYPTLATTPAEDVVGAGPFGLVAGQVTDDTQMAVCLARGLHAHGRLEVPDVAARYVAWMGEAFDVGNQTRSALGRIQRGQGAWEAGLATWRASGRQAAGNGSLMRTAPLGVALAGAPAAVLLDAAIADSMITHADPRCLLACAAFDAAIAAAVVAPGALTGGALVEVARTALAAAAGRLTARWGTAVDAEGMADAATIAAAHAALAQDLDAAEAPDPQLYGPELHLHRMAGFVRVAFRLAFWHVVHTPRWQAAVVDVASRGGDADTNAAIVGALLGARDGLDAIPEAWRTRVLGATQPGSPTWAAAHHPRHLLALT